MRKYTIKEIDDLRAIVSRRLPATWPPAAQRIFLVEAFVQTLVQAGIHPDEFGEDPEPETAPKEESFDEANAKRADGR